jgi:transposase
MKKPAQHIIAEVPRRQAKVEITIGIDLGDVWSHYCTLNQDGEVVDRGRFRTKPKAIEKWSQRGLRWRRERTRSGSAHSYRN